jgi:hypothetical protein
MAKGPGPSTEWDPKNVVKRLQQKMASGGSASAQIFFSDDVPGDRVLAKAEEIAEETSKRLGLDRAAVKIGKVHRLAKSFSLTSDEPRVFSEILKSPAVKSILESEQSDILPQPIRKKSVP